MRTKSLVKLSRNANKLLFKFKKHSPEILIVAGIAGTITSTIMACKATTKVSEILDESKEMIDVIHAGAEDGQINGVEYTEEDCKKDLTITYVKTGIKLVKLYAPAVALGTLSIASIVTSNHILRKRNVALAAAYATLDKSYKDYRSRVVERFGEKIDRELKYNIKAKELEYTETDENGNEVTKKDTFNVAEYDGVSDYARFFDELSPYWEKDTAYNLTFLKQQERYLNDRLQKRGYLFLNEVYKALGIPETKAGQQVGWVYNEKHPVGDNYVEFIGLHDYNSLQTRAFINGHEPAILLDFNVDGYIMDLAWVNART